MLNDTMDCNTVSYGHAQKLRIVTSDLGIIYDVIILPFLQYQYITAQRQVNNVM